MRILGILSVCLAVALPPVAAHAKESALQGDWETVQTCGTWSRSVVLKVRDGSKGRLKGTAQVEKRSGKIVSGSVDGRTFELKAAFTVPLDPKNRVDEVWTGKVSRDGKSIRGKFVSSDPHAPKECTFRGKRR
jgi:hypothetical protein